MWNNPFVWLLLWMPWFFSYLRAIFDSNSSIISWKKRMNECLLIKSQFSSCFRKIRVHFVEEKNTNMYAHCTVMALQFVSSAVWLKKTVSSKCACRQLKFEYKSECDCECDCMLEHTYESFLHCTFPLACVPYFSLRILECSLVLVCVCVSVFVQSSQQHTTFYFFLYASLPTFNDINM